MNSEKNFPKWRKKEQGLSKGMGIGKFNILGSERSELFIHRNNLPGQINKPHLDYSKEKLPKGLLKGLDRG